MSLRTTTSERQRTALLLVAKDPWAEPKGGQTTFAKSLVRCLGPKLAVVATSDEPLPVGKWSHRSFDGQSIPFFNLGPLALRDGRKPLVPVRLAVYRRVRRWLSEVRELGISSIFVDSPELLLAVQRQSWSSVCYSFAGVENPVSFSRYRCLRPLGGLFEAIFLRALDRIQPDAMIAAADEAAIHSFCLRTRGRLAPNQIHSFPTRVDTSTFLPKPVAGLRRQLGISESQLVLVCTGRISWVKGWDFLLDGLWSLVRRGEDARLIFVGDGEDRSKLLARAAEMDLSRRVTVTGFLPQTRVCDHINAGDVSVVGSHREGWSLAMIEALACGKPLVSTLVSGARDLIDEGVNGFILSTRDPDQFATAVLNAATLPRASQVSLEISQRYSTDRLAVDLGQVWAPFSDE